MKCIEGEYGNICKKGLLSNIIKQGENRIKLSDVKKILKSYQKNSNKPYYYDRQIKSFDVRLNCYLAKYKYNVYFTTKPSMVITIGCKSYSKETVEAAIKAFL